jgi:hypothetical protein
VQVYSTICAIGRPLRLYLWGAWLRVCGIRWLGPAPFLLPPLLGLLLRVFLPTLILRVGIPFVAEVANRPRLASQSRPIVGLLGAVSLDMPLLATGVALALEAGLAVGGGRGDREGLLLLVCPCSADGAPPRAAWRTRRRSLAPCSPLSD